MKVLHSPIALPAPLEREAVTGLVLCGGQGRRMGGVEKAWLPYDGQALVQHVLARIQPQVGRVLISANRGLERYASLGWPVVSDSPDEAGSGPLAGILAGLRACPTPWLLVVPCDTPALPLDLVARLWRSAEGGAAYSCTGSEQHFACCLLPSSTQLTLAQVHLAGQRSLASALQACLATPVQFLDEQAFLNINTPEQLA